MYTNKYQTNRLYKMVCINCDKPGHTFKYCKKPITSYGLLAYRTPHRKKTKENKKEYLLIQRRSTMGYMDFLRGKYSDLYQAKTLLEEMTQQEHKMLLSGTFDELWDVLWVWSTKSSKSYKNEYENAKLKFDSLNLRYLVENTKTKYLETEYDLPKGRRSHMENVKECAIREFMEETGYNRNEFILTHNDRTLCEIFLGSNSIWYRHIYFYAEVLTDRTPDIGSHPLQEMEVKRVLWADFKTALNIFRRYDITKRSIMYLARDNLDGII